MSLSHAIGIDLGASRIKIVAVNQAATILDEMRLETREGFDSEIATHIETLEAKLGAARWVGLAAPGLAANDSRSIAWMQGRMSRVQGLNWSKFLKREVMVLNDAHAALLGEAWLGTAAGAKDVVMLTLGTGVGGAIISGGRLLKGHIGRAGHLGHISLDPTGKLDIVNTPGSLEDALGDHTVRARSNGRFDSTKTLVGAVELDAEASMIWEQSIKSLAAAIASIINVIDPEFIVIGGGIASAGDALFKRLQKYLDEFEWRPHGHRVKIVPATLGDRAGALGAARFAMQFEETNR